MEKIEGHFKILRRTMIDNALVEYGFKQYRTTSLARLTGGNVFQYIYFHKYRFGGQFKVVVAIRPLFCHNEDYLDQYPGNSLLRMATNNKADNWWISTDYNVTEKSLQDVLRLTKEFAIPFFDCMTTSADILKTQKKNLLGISKFGGRIDWGVEGYKEFDLGHICLEAGNIGKAIKNFTNSYKIFKKDNRDWAQSKAKKCLEILELIKMGQSHIDIYMHDTIRDSRNKLKLINW